MIDGTLIALGAVAAVVVAGRSLSRGGSMARFSGLLPVDLAKKALVDDWYGEIEYVGSALGPQGPVQVFEATGARGIRYRINVGRLIGDRPEVLAEPLHRRSR
jgi:hypothetical protein